MNLSDKNQVKSYLNMETDDVAWGCESEQRVVAIGRIRGEYNPCLVKHFSSIHAFIPAIFKSGIPHPRNIQIGNSPSPPSLGMSFPTHPIMKKINQ